jgi:hypothetical protein
MYTVVWRASTESSRTLVRIDKDHILAQQYELSRRLEKIQPGFEFPAAGSAAMQLLLSRISVNKQQGSLSRPLEGVNDE